MTSFGRRGYGDGAATSRPVGPSQVLRPSPRPGSNESGRGDAVRERRHNGPVAGSVEIRVLGPLEVRLGREAAPLAGVRLRTLLIRLALDPGRVVLTSQLIDAVWGEEPPDGATNALQSLVARVRRALPGLIETHPTGYRLVVPDDAVDAVRFEALAAGGRRRLGDDPAGAASDLREALALWRGPALADAADAGFAVAAAARLEELRLGALEDRIEADLAAGGDGTVVAELEALVAGHPLRERLNGQLVRALAATGRQADALAAFERLRARLADELGIDPSEELRAIQLAVLRGESERPEGAPAPSGPAGGEQRERAPAARTNLRSQITSFVGRERDVERIASVLADSRLVTLVGPGGSGKTRLASEAGAGLVDRVPGGVWMIELAPVGDPGELPQAFLSVFGARETGLLARAGAGAVSPRERLTEAIGDRHLLLLVDNCEHLISAVAALTDHLLGRCPSLHVLATSREPLGITGEVLVPVEPLAMPKDGAGIAPATAKRSAAVRLFADRAESVQPAFEVDESTVRDVVAICRALDGMPLAIELAAARLRSLTTGQIADRLDDRFRLLGVGGGAALPRHKTLRAVVDWSWDLLTEPERMLLRRLAVFPAGANLEAAEAVCAGGELDGPPREEVLYLLASLVEKSLVVSVRDDGTNEVRYRMLDTIRAYADERRREAGEDEVLRRAHAEFLADFGAAADPHLRGPEQVKWLARLWAERDNIHAALRFAVDAGDAALAMRLVALLGWYWFMRGSRAEALEWADRALALPGDVPPTIRAGGLLIRSLLGVTGGSEFELALRLGDEAVTIIRTLPPEELVRFPTLEFGETLMAMFRGEDERALALARAQFDSPDLWVRGLGHLVAGQLLINMGEVEQASDEIDTAVAQFRKLGDHWGLGNSLVAFADLRATRGDQEAAAAALREAQEVFRLLDDREDIAQLMIREAAQRAQAGEFERALDELDAAERIAEEIGAEDQKLWIRQARAEAARTSGRLDDARQMLDGAIADFQGFGKPIDQLHAMLLVTRGRVEVTAGELEEAVAWYRWALRVALGTRDYPIVARTVELRADVALAAGDAGLAATLLGTAEVVRGVADQADPEVRRVRAGARAALGDPGFDRAYRRGAARSRAEVLEALGAEAEDPQAPQAERPRAEAGAEAPPAAAPTPAGGGPGQRAGRTPPRSPRPTRAPEAPAGRSRRPPADPGARPTSA